MGTTPRPQPSRFKAKRGAGSGPTAGASPCVGAGPSQQAAGAGAGPSARIDQHPRERATYSALSDRNLNLLPDSPRGKTRSATVKSARELR